MFTWRSVRDRFETQLAKPKKEVSSSFKDYIWVNDSDVEKTSSKCSPAGETFQIEAKSNCSCN